MVLEGYDQNGRESTTLCYTRDTFFGDTMSDERRPALALLRQEIHRGLLHVHDRLALNADEARRTLALLTALVDLLARKGQIQSDDLEARKQAAAILIGRNSGEEPLKMAYEEIEEADKYTAADGVEIDCDRRIPYCRASCCRLFFSLSKQDIQEGIVEWNLETPYIAAKGADGYCAHLDRGTKGCSVWKNRPLTCRRYDCRSDKRIWVDFEKMIPNPALQRDDWPNCLATAKEPPHSHDEMEPNEPRG